MERPYFPMFIDMTDKSVLVAGGGRIALRRVRTMLRFGAQEHMRREILRGYRLCWLPRTAGR